MDDRKTLLIVSGGVEAADAAKRAKEMGLYVVVSDRDPEAPGFAFADSSLIADVYGAGETAAAAERFSRKIRKIDGVICVAADAPVTAATVARRLGLPGISVESAELACDKLAMKRRFAERGVPVPWFDQVRTVQELQRIAVERGSNLVIKPVDSRGSRGVQRVAQVADLAKAYAFAKSHSPTERVMVEQYLDGPQISTESVVVNGECFTPGFSDRNYEYLERYAPFFIENGGDLPSHLSPELQQKVKDVVAKAAAALGVTHGTVKGDMVVHNGEAYVIELAARLSGGFFCTCEIPLNTGVDFIGAAIRVALGEAVPAEELTPKTLTPVIQRYAFPRAGRVMSVSGAEDARKIAGVNEVIVTARPGDIIPAAGDKRPSAAMVLTTGPSREAALKAANDALACLNRDPMNAPLTERDLLATAGTLQVYALFHLNLAFSSIEEEQRATVIEKCYWPLLRLAERFGPIGIEATGYTLEEIALRDPEWIGRARALLARGRIELIGSGYSQMIGPLVPAKVTEANLRIGNEVYQRLLGVTPTIALVNEQAYSAGLVGLYLDAGYRALAMDWDNPGAAHPHWAGETRYLPQRALGADGRSIGLIWTNTVAFQKTQRFVHRDIEIDPYLDYVRGHRAAQRRALCVYASDAEIFDYRPGRYKTEEASAGDEWMRMEEAFARLTDEFEMVAPSDVLALRDTADAGQTLRLETATMPIPVKKQRKYNLARWAVTGHDDLGINAACERIYRGMAAGKASAADWKELCWLWASDFRTHATEKRWTKFTARLAAAEVKWSAPPSLAPAAGGDVVECRQIDVATPFVAARLDRRRGLALSTVQFAGQAKPALGGLAHGHFDDIALQADWYTGDCVFEAPGEHKITDLEWAVTRRWTEPNGDVCVGGRVETAKGPIDKTLRFCATEPRIDFDLTFHWNDWGKGSLRLGHVTLLDDAFDAARLSLLTQNGGSAVERFDLAGQTVEHGAPVSFLVSSSHGLGMTEGWAEIGDDHTRVRVEVDRETACLLGMLTHRVSGGKVFCQLMLSALELDDTRKPNAYRGGPRRFRFSLVGVAA